MNLQEYWAEVRRIEQSLPEGEVWLVSERNTEKGTTPGQVVLCERAGAARRIYEKTHRLATTEEIGLARLADEEARRRIQEAEYERKQHFALPRELAALVEAAAKPKKN